MCKKILGFNLFRDLTKFSMETAYLPFACDVSWIFGLEPGESILMVRDAAFRIDIQKSVQIGNKQWFVCDGYGGDGFYWPSDTFETIFHRLRKNLFTPVF